MPQKIKKTPVPQLDLKGKALEKAANILLKASNAGSVSLTGMLSGGVVSEVYDGIYTDTQGELHHVAVKRTFENIELGNNFTIVEQQDFLPNAAKTHDLDVEIQKHLQSKVKTPRVIQHFSDEKITVMHNFASEGFSNLQEEIVEGRLTLDSAAKIGTILAQTRLAMHSIKNKVTQVEKTDAQFMQRFAELLIILYDKRQEIGQMITYDFISHAEKTFVWTDGHPKNMAIDKTGEIMVFDFGRSIVCDPEYALPNFLGQIYLFILAGTLETQFGITYIKNCMKAYEKAINIGSKKPYVIDQRRFVNYATAELLHRGLAMRWISYTKKKEDNKDMAIKNACMHFGNIVFGKEMNKINLKKHLELLAKVTDLVKKGEYDVPEIRV
ncbi:MAG: hypothetical protein V4576_01510 [Patescibacteria group bacterium]